MQVAAKLEDVDSSGGIAVQVDKAAATPQIRVLYEVMSVTLSSYHYIKSGTDTGVLEMMQKWAWSERNCIRRTHS